ncbi:MAG: carbon storage regulator [Planctomycetes bacterium]|nr:carbon storage regulator [Planctomycetota bacterium]
MLVLMRKKGQAIVVGQDVTVTVLEVHGSRVKLGLTAPADVPIRREDSVEPPPTVPPPWRCAQCA